MENEMLETTNETENTETQAAENIVEGIELTDTADVETEEPQKEEEAPKEKEEVKTLRELIKENPQYQSEFDSIVQSRLKRKDKDHERELAKYRDTENVLKATIGGDNITEINKNLRNLYEKDGVELPEVYNPGLTSEEIEVLAKHEAQSIIDDGYDSMVEEANRLAKKKFDNLSSKEKIIFTTLAERLTDENNRSELLKLGAKAELIEDKDFIKFKNQFRSEVPIKDIYEQYMNQRPKKVNKNPGSMKNTPTEKTKDYYTAEEIKKMTLDDLDKPGVFEAVRKSMTSQKN